MQTPCRHHRDNPDMHRCRSQNAVLTSHVYFKVSDEFIKSPPHVNASFIGLSLINKAVSDLHSIYVFFLSLLMQHITVDKRQTGCMAFGIGLFSRFLMYECRMTMSLRDLPGLVNQYGTMNVGGKVAALLVHALTLTKVNCRQLCGHHKCTSSSINR